MKKWMRAVLCLVLVLGVFLCLGGCGSDKETETKDKPSVKENVTGRYELKKIQWDDGTTISGDALEDAEDQMGDMYVELFRDGTATLSLYGQIRDMEFSDDEMWQESNPSISYDFSVSNGKVILKEDGDKYTFEKK